MSGGWSGGVFSLSVDMSANDAAGINIVSSAFSNQSDEIKDGINACLTKDGTNTPSADLPMGTKKHSNVGAAVTITNYLRTHEYITSNPIYMVDQTAGSLSVTCSTLYWPTSAVAGMRALIKMGATKPQDAAAEVPIVINGLTLSATGPNGQPLDPGALVSAQIHEFVYDGAKFRLTNPSVTVKKYTALMRCRKAADASVTVITGRTVTVLAALNGDVVNLWLDNKTGAAMAFGTSTGTAIVWSATPSHLLADASMAVSGMFVDTSIADTPTAGNPAYMMVGTSRISWRLNSGGTFGSAVTLWPFSATYPRKRSL